MTGPPLGIDVAFRSDTGRTRRHNEDYVGYYEPQSDHEMAASGRLYIVADGVGGAAAGEVASQYAVRKVLAEYYAADEPDPESRLIRAVTAANADIYNFADARPRPMATTLVAAVVREDELIIANVGDSRAYLVRGGKIRQVTEDHSLTAQMVRQGKLSEEEAELHPKRNLLVRTVGGADRVQVDVFGGPLLLGDVVVLCTDGLTRYVSEAEITEAVSSMRPQQAVDVLVRTANERGGKDNITVLVLQVVEPDDDLDTEPRARALDAPGSPDLHEIEQTLAARRETPAPRPPVPVSPLALGAVAAVALGLVLLALGGGFAGGSAAAGTPTALPRATTQAGNTGPTETPSAVFEAGADVRFMAEAALYASPGLSAGAVLTVAQGQDAEVQGGPTWSDSGNVWWLLRLTPPDGTPVMGWALQANLDRLP